MSQTIQVSRETIDAEPQQVSKVKRCTSVKLSEILAIILVYMIRGVSALITLGALILNYYMFGSTIKEMFDYKKKIDSMYDNWMDYIRFKWL